MPIDPSIIGNIMAPQAVQMPDVNAMMQTQTRGMENVYKIEAARGAQAKEDAKAQEDAAVKALLPAYAHAFKTGDMRGALSLAPPQYQEGLLPYIEALDGKPIEEIQAALTGSLVTSEVGRAFLDNQARMTTAGIQQGQLDVSRGNLAIEKAKMEAEAKAGKKVARWIENNDGTATGFDDYGNIVVTVPGVGKKTATTGPDGVKLKPDQRLKEDGTVELIPGSTTYNKQKSDFANDYKSAKASLQAINNLKTKVDTLAKTTGFQKMMNTGAYMTAIPNTPLASLTGAYDFQSKFDDVVSAVNTFGREIASMSGKLGNMAVQEWKNVAGSVANMDPSKMSSADLDRQLNSIATQLAIAENNVRNAYELEYGGGQFYSPLEDQGQAKTQGGGKTRPAGVGPDWTHMTDANGVSAWVSPDQKQIIEAQ